MQNTIIQLEKLMLHISVKETLHVAHTATNERKQQEKHLLYLARVPSSRKALNKDVLYFQVACLTIRGQLQ